LPDSVRNHINEVLLEITGAPKGSARPGNRQRQYVGAITAPIFNQLGRVAHNICAHPFTALSLRNVEQLGRQLRQAAGAIGGWLTAVALSLAGVTGDDYQVGRSGAVT
jgi:hypothetical protein